MKTKLFGLVLATSSSVAAIAAGTHPLEETLVTASRTEMSAREVGSSVTVLDAEDIQVRGLISIQDILRTLPSVAVSNSGGLGKQSALRIRGEESFRTLVLVDGIDYSDPTTTQVQSQIQHLLVTDIERIEVLRGPQGMIYGADAGGVINIITKKGEGAPSGNLQAETGRYGTQRLIGNLRGKSGVWDYALNINDVKTDGFNARDIDSTLQDEDGYESSTFSANLGWQLNSNLRLELNSRHIDADNEFDGCFDASFSITHNCQSAFQQQTHKLALKWKSDRMEQRLAYQRSDLERENIAAGSQSFLAEGGVDEVQYFGAVSLSPDYQLIFGIDWEEQFIDSSSPRQDRRQTGSYVELQADIEKQLFFSIGTRFDDNEDFGEHWSHRVTTAYLIPLAADTVKLRASYGTGFRAPSLFETAYNAGPFAAPPASTTELSEETSEGFDLGVEYLGHNGATFGLTYFDQQIEDAIEFDLVGFSGYLQTDGDSSSTGWEANADIPLEPRTSLIANHTYNDAEDQAGNPRLRRPKRITNIGINHQMPDIRVSVFMNYRFVRDAVDVGQVPLADYQVLDINIDWQATDKLNLYLRTENVAGKQYQEVTSYNTAGAASYLGARLNF